MKDISMSPNKMISYNLGSFNKFLNFISFQKISLPRTHRNFSPVGVQIFLIMRPAF